MISTKETSINYRDLGTTNHRLSFVAGTLAERLNNGEYLLRPLPRATIFIRYDDWSDQLEINSLQQGDPILLQFNNGDFIEIDNSHFQAQFGDNSCCRVVVISEQGICSFLIEY